MFTSLLTEELFLKAVDVNLSEQFSCALLILCYILYIDVTCLTHIQNHALWIIYLNSAYKVLNLVVRYLVKYAVLILPDSGIALLAFAYVMYVVIVIVHLLDDSFREYYTYCSSKLLEMFFKGTSIVQNVKVQ